MAISLLGIVPLAQAQSLYRLTASGISISAALGETVLPNYLLRFGIFQNNFVPTPANIALWNSNFIGASGTYQDIPPSAGVSAFAEFSASDNSLYPIESQLYLIVYNIAPNASISTATKGVILTRSGWTVQEAFDISGNRTRNYWYESGGSFGFIGNFDEHNTLPASDPQNFSSPINEISSTPLSGSFNGYYTITTSFNMVPEPSSASLGLAGLAGVLATRRRK